MKTKRIFNWDLKQKKHGIKLWEKILLQFKKPYYGVDYGYHDSTVVVTVKKMFGKIYIVDEKIADNLKERIK